ncbi:LysR family transcriptional regulator [Alicyclobacillus acidiphilus]|nr:LysR family transcriptional regulator [Alicyclobacillus acidiphilus]
MELRQLEYFIAVAEELHFGRAASRLGMTQPPLSQQIRQLEDELGVLLFHRTNRRVELSDAGRVYLGEVRRLFALLQQAEQMARKAQLGKMGRLVLGFVGSATYDVLPSVIRVYQDQYPDVDLVLHEMPTPDQIDALLNGTIDVGVLRPPTSHPALTVRTIRRDQCVAVVPVSHRLAAEKSITMKQLRGEQLILVSRSIWPGLYDSIVTLFHEAGVSPSIRLEVTEVQTVVGLVGAEIGVSILPGSTQHVHTRDVRYLPITGERPQVEMGVAWRREDQSEVLKQFLAVIDKMAVRTDGQTR